MTETAEAKADRYLVEGRVNVKAVAGVGVEAEVQGTAAAPYHVRREGRRWSGDCPSWHRLCAHVRAVRTVT